MTEAQYAVLIKALLHEYYQKHISLAEYRERRDKIIGEMDKLYNGTTR